MTRKADTLRPFLRCAAVILCSLALPLAVLARRALYNSRVHCS